MAPVADDGTVPDVDGRNLDGEDYSIPADFEGQLNLLLVGFHREQQADIDRWIPAAERLENSYPSLRYYELPVIDRLYRPVRPFIDSGMQRGVPETARERTITLYLNVTAFRRSLGLPSRVGLRPARRSRRRGVLGRGGSSDRRRRTGARGRPRRTSRRRLDAFERRPTGKRGSVVRFGLVVATPADVIATAAVAWVDPGDAGTSIAVVAATPIVAYRYAVRRLDRYTLARVEPAGHARFAYTSTRRRNGSAS
ncbi:MAG: hypothetical protein ACOCS7_02150 [Halolamina sp.]